MTAYDACPSNIGYFAMRSTLDGEGHIGAAIVVDAKGIPLEFRCSVPVRPSAIQVALYGDRIRDYIAFNLCGQALMESLTVKPKVCLVESESLLALQAHISIPVFHACRYPLGGTIDEENGGSEKKVPYRRLLQSQQPNDHPAVSDGESINESGEDCTLLQSAANFAPVALRCLPNWNRSLQDLLPDLRLLFGSIDLVEPFERVTAGCRLLCQEDERFK